MILELGDHSDEGMASVTYPATTQSSASAQCLEQLPRALDGPSPKGDVVPLFPDGPGSEQEDRVEHREGG